ncbi:hypothetical protein cmbei_4004070 [Cryptosporidium meleagridis]
MFNLLLLLYFMFLSYLLYLHALILFKDLPAHTWR